jgi:acetylornithine/succinyldiaminopimelate/putrescine aminotransferase
LNSVYFVNSGSEAIDAAMKLAKRYTGNSGFVAQDQAYHGSGQGPLSLMNDAYFTQAYRPLLNNVYYIKQNDIQAVKNLPSSGVAGVFIELIQSERGAKIASLDYVLAVREYCNRTGALLIVDEIQTGLYRTGMPFEFLRYEIQPDILVLGKSLGGGMPLGCIITSTKIMSAFTQNPILGHITTFGGHPVCAAAGLASSKYIFENHLTLDIQRKGQLFKNLLKHKAIVSVEGQGLLLACHLHESINIIEFNKALLRGGVFTDWFLFNMNAIRIAPPLIISDEQINQVCLTILDNLDVFFGG